MSTEIRYYDETGRDVTAEIGVKHSSRAAQFALRDFFAGCALMSGYASGRGGVKGLAIRAFEIADAMLRAREI